MAGAVTPCVKVQMMGPVAQRGPGAAGGDFPERQAEHAKADGRLERHHRMPGSPRYEEGVAGFHPGIDAARLFKGRKLRRLVVQV